MAVLAPNSMGFRVEEALCVRSLGPRVEEALSVRSLGFRAGEALCVRSLGFRVDEALRVRMASGELEGLIFLVGELAHLSDPGGPLPVNSVLRWA